MKIYSDDPNLPYKTTKLKALYTKSEIDGCLCKFRLGLRHLLFEIIRRDLRLNA